MQKIWWIVLAVIVVVGLWSVGSYNSMVQREETVNAAWAQVENQFQRRADLVPNLVETVQGFAAQEREVFTAVTEARASATQQTVSLEDAQDLARFQEAQGELSQALGRLLAVSENYPQLRSNENFLALQAELAGTENRIATERMRFNEAVRNFNVSIRQFPRVLLAGWFGFEKFPLFEAEEGADEVPSVEF